MFVIRCNLNSDEKNEMGGKIIIVFLLSHKSIAFP